MNTPLKHCNKCQTDYPSTEEYWVTKHGKLQAICRACRSAAARAWYAANKLRVIARKANYTEVQKEQLRAAQRRRYALDPTKAIAATRAWQAAHPEAVKKAARKWYANNAALAYERNIEWHKQNPQATKRYNEQATNTPAKRAYKSFKSTMWAKKNPDKANALRAKRRAAKMLRTPAWLNSTQLKAIREFYRLASELSITTGIPHHVDHIVPLRGKSVSGLHVPWNLQILTASENSAKNNRF